MQNWQVRLIQLLAVPGIMIAFYLLLFHNGSLIASCSGGGWDDCGAVSGPNAPYSTIGSIPVALIGLIGYLLIYLLTWLGEWSDALANILPELLVGVIGLGFLVTLGLTGLELFVIHSFCRYCVYSAIVITIMMVLAVHFLRRA